MARYGDFLTGILTSENLSENDLRAFFPVNSIPLPAEETGENTFDPDIQLTFAQAVTFVYRMLRIRILVDLVVDGFPIFINELQWVMPNSVGTADEREIPKSSWGMGVLGRSFAPTDPGYPLSGTFLSLRSYNPTTQGFQIAFLWNTGLPYAVGTSRNPTYVATAGTLNIFGHITPLWHQIPSDPLPVVTGGITVTPHEYRQYEDSHGSNPIWGEFTGNQLINPVPSGLG